MRKHQPPLAASVERLGFRLESFATNTLVWLVLLAMPVVGHTQSNNFIEEMSTKEVSAALKAGKTTIIIPVGGTEQSGPHMAIGKHNTRAKALAGQIATSLGNALVAPVMAYVPEGDINPPTEHMVFAGTVSIPEDVFRNVLIGAARSFKQHGFTDIVLLGDHGGYQKSLATVALQFNREAAKSLSRVHYIPEYYRVTQTEYASALKSKGLTVAEIGTHAGSADTSLMMAIDGSMVYQDRFGDAASAGWRGGTLGDPRASSIKTGQLGIDIVVTATVAAIKKAVSSLGSR